MEFNFDFSELRGRIIARFDNYANFAKAVHLSRAQVSERLNGTRAWKPHEVYRACSPEVLDIAPENIGKYFFTLRV